LANLHLATPFRNENHHLALQAISPSTMPDNVRSERSERRWYPFLGRPCPPCACPSTPRLL